ncbi:hypothetical protein DL771_006707 [Monosporascus sp. 5C6A]|nr:hypothetical protein DL771_006707 [Monosporascus sp. 5C6A]
MADATRDTTSRPSIRNSISLEAEASGTGVRPRTVSRISDDSSSPSAYASGLPTVHRSYVRAETALSHVAPSSPMRERLKPPALPALGRAAFSSSAGPERFEAPSPTREPA